MDQILQIIWNIFNFGSQVVSEVEAFLRICTYTDKFILIRYEPTAGYRNRRKATVKIQKITQHRILPLILNFNTIIYQNTQKEYLVGYLNQNKTILMIQTIRMIQKSNNYVKDNVHLQRLDYESTVARRQGNIHSRLFIIQ